MTDDFPGLSSALHERVADEHPDLDHLVRVSTRTGARLRRRRTAAVCAGAVVASAAVVGIAGSLAGSGGTPAAGPGVAADPTPTPPPPSPTAELVPAQTSPVRLDLPGWRCDDPADEKFSCTKHGAIVTITWRPAADRAAYLDPGKADVLPGVHTFVSRVHGPFFVTVAPAPGTTQEQVDQVGSGLAWAP